MKTLKERFIEGAFKQNKVPPDKGDMIWELMAAFAGYGFPKAHAASYAQIGWRSAWCKVHYPAEFIAAVLANWGGYYSQRIYLSEARRMGHIVQPPHINHAGKRFTVAYPDGEAVIYIGLDQVSSLTQKTQSRIIAERPFKSLGDLLTRVDPRPIEIKNLIQVGALRGFGAIPELLSKIESGGWRYRQPPLFDIDYETIVADEWDINKRVAAQQSILGASLDAHPIELLQQEIISKHSPISSSELHTNIGETVRILGIRQTLQRLGGQSGSQVYALELEDLDGLITILLPQELYNHQKIILRSHQPLVVEGSVAYESKLREPVLLAERVWSAYN